MKNISVLITVFNRKQKTLECLDNLYIAFNSFNIASKYELNVFLTDDGSTDGTANAVKDKFPNVVVLNGSGDLFWNRGMINSWKEAAKFKPDFYLWLNDDTSLSINAFEVLFYDYNNLEDKSSILVGGTKSKVTGEITYGAEKKYIKLKPNGLLQRCDTFNGNFVLIPDCVFDKLGMLDGFYSHSLGDYDYGWRATKSNVNSYLLSSFIGFCELNEGVKKCFNPMVPLKERIKHLYSPLGCNPVEFFHFDKNNFGLGKAFKHFFSIHLKAIFIK